MARKFKVLWHEEGRAHVIFGEEVADADPVFLSFRLQDGHTIRLNKVAIIKIEEAERYGQ